MNLDEFLFPDLLHRHWQMSQAERMALCHLLGRIQPKLAIEVGTYQGGSLSLIARQSGWVYSIDIDPDVPRKFAHFENVTFVTESSASSLPALLSRLESEQAPLEFVLIDGDHSAEGVRRDLNSILKYKPSRDVYVLMHDSFNADCRTGILGANWADARHVAFANLDFIPGQIMQQGGPYDGQLWGGLAMVVLKAEPQPAVQLLGTSDWMHRKCARPD